MVHCRSKLNTLTIEYGTQKMGRFKISQEDRA